MKKVLLSLFALLFTVSMFADTETLNVSSKNDVKLLTITAGGTSSTGSDIAFYSESGLFTYTGKLGFISGEKVGCPIYKKGSLTIAFKSGVTGKQITSIKVVYPKDCYPFAEAIPTGGSATSKTTAQCDATYNIEEDGVTSVTFTNKAGGKTDIRYIYITYEDVSTVPALGDATSNTDKVAEGLVNITFPKFDDQAAATSASNKYKLVGNATIDLDGTVIKTVSSAEYEASNGFTVEGNYKQAGDYTITIPKKALQLVDSEGNVLGENKKEIVVTFYVEPDYPDLQSPSIDKSYLEDEGCVCITFPDFIDYAASLDNANTYEFTGTMTVDGGSATPFSGHCSAGMGLVFPGFEYGHEYVVTIPKFGAKLTDGTDVLGSNLRPIIFRVSPAGEDEANFKFTKKYLMNNIKDNAYKETMEWANDKKVDYKIDATVDGPYTIDDITVTFAQGKSKNNMPIFYSNGDAVRMYTNNTITLSTCCNNITSVQLVAANGYGYKDMNASEGEIDPETGIWTGKATELVFTWGGGSQTRITDIIVSYDEIVDDAATLAAKEIYAEEYEDILDDLEEYEEYFGQSIFRYTPGAYQNTIKALAEIDAKHAHSEQAVYDKITELRNVKRALKPLMPKADDKFLVQNVATKKFMSLDDKLVLTDEAKATPIQFHNCERTYALDLALLDEADIAHFTYIYNTPNRQYLSYGSDLKLTNKALKQFCVITLPKNLYVIGMMEPVEDDEWDVTGLLGASVDSKTKVASLVYTTIEDMDEENIKDCYWYITRYTEPEPAETTPGQSDSSADDATAITSASSAAVPVAIYSANGTQLKAAQKGLNILRMSDNTVKKIIVK